jgi:hypothetical protein
MPETVAQPIAAPAPSPGLLSRAIGIIFSPRATYAAIAARPRVLGALCVILCIMAAGLTTFLSTEVGREALLDQQIRQREAFGRPMTAEQTAQMERILPYIGYFAAAGQVVSVVLIVFVVAGLMFAVFNALLGGDATFKQVLSVTVHSGFVIALQQFFVLPLDYVRESLTSPTSLSVFMPFLEETSFAARFLGALDLSLMWWMVNLAIGLGVLYKRRTGPIATSMFVTYLVIALAVAAIRSALTGS